MIDFLKHRPVKLDDLEVIAKFPQNDNELFFMYPKAEFPLTVDQLQTSINNRFDSTVIVLDNHVVGFANFYEAELGRSCSIGNVIVNPLFRGKGFGAYMISIMENIAITKYHVTEIHISCFNQNVNGLLLYNKLGYLPYAMEKRLDKKSVPLALIKMKKVIKQ